MLVFKIIIGPPEDFHRTCPIQMISFGNRLTHRPILVKYFLTLVLLIPKGL
eukprot:UN11829